MLPITRYVSRRRPTRRLRNSRSSSRTLDLLMVCTRNERLSKTALTRSPPVPAVGALWPRCGVGRWWRRAGVNRVSFGLTRYQRRAIRVGAAVEPLVTAQVAHRIVPGRTARMRWVSSGFDSGSVRPAGNPITPSVGVRVGGPTRTPSRLAGPAREAPSMCRWRAPDIGAR